MSLIQEPARRSAYATRLARLVVAATLSLSAIPSRADAAPGASDHPEPPACLADQLLVLFETKTFKLGDERTSYSVKNTGSSACSLFAMPKISFEDAHHRPLPLKDRWPYDFRLTIPVHDIVLQPSATAMGAIQWTTAKTTCGRTAFAKVTFGAAVLESPFVHGYCPAAGDRGSYFVWSMHVAPASRP